MRDKKSEDQYRENIIGARHAIPKLLRLFETNDIHATWATVGFLIFEDVEELEDNRPEITPSYDDRNFSSYHYISESNALDPLLHFAPDLVNQIAQTPGQEVGSHTFSHFYSLEKGPNKEEFRAEIKAAVNTAAKSGISIRSLVFPRNQCKVEYLDVLEELGIRSFRGTEKAWMYRTADEKGQTFLMRTFRFLDTYINLSGYNTYDLAKSSTDSVVNLPSSRYLRPFKKQIATLDFLKFNRIKNAMTYAAKNGHLFHLWWHPHNFGVNLEKNMAFLKKILNHFEILHSQLGMQSLNMGEIEQLLRGDGIV